MLHKYQVIARSNLLLTEITWCIYSDQLCRPVLYTQCSAALTLLYVVCGKCTHVQMCALIHILLIMQLKNTAGVLSMEIDVGKKLKLWILEKKNHLEAVKYVSDIRLPMQTNWHSESWRVRGTDIDRDQNFAGKQEVQ